MKLPLLIIKVIFTISKQLKAILAEIKQIRNSDAGEDKYLDNTDVMRMLNLGPRSLHRYRTSGLLPYTKTRGKIYYRLADVKALQKGPVQARS